METDAMCVRSLFHNSLHQHDYQESNIDFVKAVSEAKYCYLVCVYTSGHFVIVVRRISSLAQERGCLFFKGSASLQPRQLVSLPRPPESWPRGPGLILLHHITILINVTDYTLGKSGPRSWAKRPKCLLAHKCEKSECPLVLSHLCLRSFWRLRTDLWHLILCQKWISILFRWWFSMWGYVCLCRCVKCVSPLMKFYFTLLVGFDHALN